MRNQAGGVITKLLVGLFALAVLGSVAMYFVVRSDEPLGLSSDVTVDVNRAVRRAEPPEDVTATLVRGGEIYVATFVRNDGRFPVTFDGLGELGEIDDVPYIPIKLMLGNGADADPSAGAEFTPTTLDPGEGVGVLVIFAPNPDLLCQLLPDEAAGRGWRLDGFPVKGTVYGVSITQQVGTSDPLARIAPASRADCENAFADL
jgi:hypothetical protein